MVLIINELSSYLHIIYYYQDGENPPACFVWSAGVVSRGRRAWMKIICPIRNDSLDFFFSYFIQKSFFFFLHWHSLSLELYKNYIFGLLYIGYLWRLTEDRRTSYYCIHFIRCNHVAFLRESMSTKTKSNCEKL